MHAKLADAIALWRRGAVQDAERACTALLVQSADATEARALLAQIYSDRGEFRAASEQLQRIVQRQPRDAASWRRLGDAQFAAQAYAAAAKSFQHAIELEPHHPRAHNNLGRALAQLSQFKAAIESYRRAIELEPTYAIAHNNLGMALDGDGQRDEALACYERALSLNPNFVEALGNQGNTLLRLERGQEALVYFERALALQPANVTLLCNCGNAFAQQREHGRALACHDEALRLMPDLPLALRGRANALKASRHFDEALACYGRAVALEPEDLEARLNQASLYLDLERWGEAIACCNQILEQHPAAPRALFLRGTALSLQIPRRYEEAIADFTRLYELDPEGMHVLGILLHTCGQVFDWSNTALVPKALQATRAGQSVVTPLEMLALSDDAALQLQCATTCVTKLHAPAPTPLWRGERWQNPKIRIAYISADLHAHPLSYLMVGVFERHDRERFEILGISLRAPSGDPFGARVLSSVDLFLDVSAQTDQQAAQLLRDLKVDIAVDLMGITRSHRLDILGYRPAPVQVNYLGYPGSCGAPYIDYILADDFIIPHASQRHYSEQVVYLPDCFQANDDRRGLPARIPSRAEAGLPERALVFCSFNSCYKIQPEMFELWCRLLLARPESVLWMLAESDLAQANLRRIAASHGIDPSRILFGARAQYGEHLARLQLADLFLDSFPFTAGATASDALWAGVPVLTCAGEAFASRMAGSLLRTLGLPELITIDLASYELRALELSASPPTLRALRERLAANRATSALFDTERFCRHLESAYDTMHQRHQRGESPTSFAVAPLPRPEQSCVHP
jgi:protein O-GlcNAc transferase